MAGDGTRRVFQFGAFEANETVGELRKRGVRIKLHSQPFQVLITLLERPSELVTREELRQRLWGVDTFVDFDHGLNTAVNKIREALDDSASQPRYIETVSGKGYRFIAPVTLAAPASNLSEKPVPDAAKAEGTRAANVTASSQVGTLEADMPLGTLLTASHELPRASRRAIRTLLALAQAMYLAFYLGALANLQEVREIFLDANLLPPSVLLVLLVTTAAVLIPVRLFILAAVAFDFPQLPAKFRTLFPVLLPFDLLWAVSPFLLVHHVSTGLALGISAALVYMPFAQRSLILMYAHER